MGRRRKNTQGPILMSSAFVKGRADRIDGEHEFKWGPPLTTVHPEVGELPTYSGLKHRTFKFRREIEELPEDAAFSSKTRRFARRTALGSDYCDPSALVISDGRSEAALAGEAMFKTSERGDYLGENWAQLLHNTRLKLEPEPEMDWSDAAIRQRFLAAKRARRARNKKVDEEYQGPSNLSVFASEAERPSGGPCSVLRESRRWTLRK